jgi:nitrogen fixation protein FixH
MRAEPARLSAARPITGRTVFLACLAFFGVITVMNVVMITLAVGTFPGVEVDSAYRAGLDYPHELASAQAQAERHWQVGAHTVRHADGVVTIAVDVRDAAGAPVSGLGARAILKRPSDAALDRTAELSDRGSGRYAGEAEGAAAGVYDLVVDLEGAAGTQFRSVNRVILDAGR